MAARKKLTANQAKALRAYGASSGWGQRPRDGGQIVDVTYGMTEFYVFERHHDRSDGEVWVIAYTSSRADERWEPWNGIVPTGRRIGVIYRGDGNQDRDY